MEMGTLASFIERHKITATALERDSNPNMLDARHDMRHWQVRLRMGRASLGIPFSQGSAHTKPPTAADVLDCLASDAAGVDNARSFEDWCGEYGYDTDSRSAERTYKACEAQAKKLKWFLGDEAYEELLWKTERE